MQEEVEQKTLTLSINAVKMTGRLLKWMISKYLAHQKQKRIEKTVPGAVKYHGKQTLKALKAAEPNLTSIEITDQNIKDFDRVARKYRVDYALKKDKSGLVPKYYVFFRAKDAASLNAAFTEYSNTVTKEKKPSVLQKLRSLIARAPVLNQNRERQKERGKSDEAAQHQKDHPSQSPVSFHRTFCHEAPAGVAACRGRGCVRKNAASAG